MEQLSLLDTADIKQKQLLYFTSALIQITPMQMLGAQETTARASRAPLSLSLPVPVRSGERSPSSHLEGNRGRTGSMPNPNVLLQPVIPKTRRQHVEVVSHMTRM